jgi:hypothetical protein
MIITAVTVLALLLGVAIEPQTRTPPAKAAATAITVYRARTCGCCGKWAEHLKAAGFDVTVNLLDNVAYAPGRERVPPSLLSCHTAFVGRYVVEGHVPADVIKDLLRKRPAVEGIAVPGMPHGSPGMESPTPEPYDVVAWDKAGKTSTFARR